MGKEELIKLTGLSEEKVIQIITTISRNNNQRYLPAIGSSFLSNKFFDRINGIIFLVMLVLLVTEDQSDVLKRKTAIFSLMDFDGTGSITVEEMEIILYCLAMGSSCILQRKHLCPSAMHIRALNMRICHALQKQKDSYISFDEFLNWSQEVVSQSIDNSTTFDVYTYFVKACGIDESKASSTPSIEQSDPAQASNEVGILEVREISLESLNGTSK